jgi:hypothetical protein
VNGAKGATGARGATGIQGPKGDPTYTRTILVSPAGDDLASGAALRTALANITDASASKRYLIKVEPGTYNVTNGAFSFDLKPFVDIEGSGMHNTKLVTTSPNGIFAASDSELRWLMVSSPSAGSGDLFTSPATATRFVLDHVDVEMARNSSGTLLKVTGGSVTVANSRLSLVGQCTTGCFKTLVDSLSGAFVAINYSSLFTGAPGTAVGVVNTAVLAENGGRAGIGWSDVTAVQGTTVRSLWADGATSSITVRAAQLFGDRVTANGALLKCGATMDEDLNPVAVTGCV